jgi:hypothetical protein
MEDGPIIPPELLTDLRERVADMAPELRVQIVPLLDDVARIRALPLTADRLAEGDAKMDAIVKIIAHNRN